VRQFRWFAVAMVCAVSLIPLTSYTPAAAGVLADGHAVGAATAIGNNRFSGQAITRTDFNVSDPSGQNCSLLLLDPQLVAQAEWFTGQYSSGSYFEFDTVHQCNGYEWWALIEHINGVQQPPIWSESINTHQVHAFKVTLYSEGNGGYEYLFAVDATLVATLNAEPYLGEGNDVEWGLESYCGTCTITAAQDEQSTPQVEYDLSTTFTTLPANSECYGSYPTPPMYITWGPPASTGCSAPGELVPDNANSGNPIYGTENSPS
jgi:hypothetical protein